MLPAARHHVFVYGTLRPGGYYHRRLVEGKPVVVTPAWTRGQLYALSPGYPGLARGENEVEGEVLSFDDEALLAALDALEGYDPARPEGGEYRRDRCEVWAPGGDSLGEVWAYWILPRSLQEYAGVPVRRWEHRDF